MVRYFDPFQSHVRVNLFPRRHNQRRRKLSSISDQHNLADESRTLYCLLDWLRLTHRILALAKEDTVRTAIRETLEETAIPVGLAPVPDRATALDVQRSLLAGASLGDPQLTLDPAALQPFARWVPKFHAVRRFDTMFFVAACPPGDWSPSVVEGECASAEWVAAAEVLDRELRGEARLIFPTRRTLERLAQHSSIAAIRADAASHPIEPISPWVEDHGGKNFITIPDHLGFPVTREPLDGLWRG